MRYETNRIKMVANYKVNMCISYGQLQDQYQWYSLSEDYQQPVCLRVVLRTADTVVYSMTNAPSQYTRNNYTFFHVMVILGEC